MTRDGIDRRGFLAGMALLGCTRAEADPAPPLPKTATTTTLAWDFPDPNERAAILMPSSVPAGVKLPVVVALHGRGEAMKAPARGALGWPSDYDLATAMDRMGRPPITPKDLHNYVNPARLKTIHAGLAARPFAGLVVVCPYLPDVDMSVDAELASYLAFLTKRLLPRVRNELPALAAAASTGIDGVSLGGVDALRLGFAAPDVFGAVGGLQPAIKPPQATEFTTLATAARAVRPQKLRLATSSEDYFRAAVNALDAAWTAAGVDHETVEWPGPHDYPWNRGPGAYELLSWHDRVLAR